MTTRFIGIKEFRKNMSKLSKESQKKKVCFIVMNHAIPVMKVTPISREDAALEQLAQDIAEARAEYKRGETYTSDEVRKMLSL